MFSFLFASVSNCHGSFFKEQTNPSKCVLVVTRSTYLGIDALDWPHSKKESKDSLVAINIFFVLIVNGGLWLVDNQ